MKKFNTQALQKNVQNKYAEVKTVTKKAAQDAPGVAKNLFGKWYQRIEAWFDKKTAADKLVIVATALLALIYVLPTFFQYFIGPFFVGLWMIAKNVVTSLGGWALIVFLLYLAKAHKLFFPTSDAAAEPVDGDKKIEDDEQKDGKTEENFDPTLTLETGDDTTDKVEKAKAKKSTKKTEEPEKTEQESES